VKLCSR